MYTLEKGHNNNYNITITINPEEWNNFVEKAYERNKSKFNISGFRNGKAPRKVVEQNYGESIFFDDALEIAFEEEYGNILANEKQIEPVSSPEIKLDKFDESGLVLNVSLQSVPEVKLGNYKGLTIESAKGEVSKEKVDAEINQHRERLARFESVDRKARKGDFAIIDFVGSVDGTIFEGGSSEDYRLELGSKTFIEGFEEQVAGMVIGEEKIVKVTFPKNYFSENLKGKDVEFKVTLKQLEEKQLPELNDEFVSNVSEFETLEEFKSDIKKHLEESLQVQLKRETENKLIDKIAEETEIEVPESMILLQIDDFVKNFESKLSYQGLTLQDYLSQTNSTIEQFKNGQRENAIKNIKTRLTLENIIKNENLDVKPEELDEKISEIASKYKKSLEDYKKSLSERELIYFENGILMDKLINFLIKENNIV
ncbi:MAG: trigger factor [Clostridia bacterium]|nr:trigger factor [Clostridia bacterium]MDD4685869.1 trigger factor [Clostridia bacterium]